MGKFKKKPVIIEAHVFANDRTSYNLLHWINGEQASNNRPFAKWINGELIIPTLEGDHTAIAGDMIIKGVQGEFYPCKPDIFEQTYDAVGVSDE